MSHRALSVLLALPVLLLVGAGADSPPESTKTPNNEVKLHKALLSLYEPGYRPVKDHKSPVNIKIRLALKYLTFDTLEETFTIHSWVAMKWKDEFLTWNPSDYGDIKELQFESHEIWTPKMALFNADVSTYQSDSFYTTCLVSNDGTVTCVPPLAHSGICSTSLRRWPYDYQDCHLYFGSWIHTGEQVNFTFFEKTPVVTEDYQNGPGWHLENVLNERLAGQYKCCPNDTYPMLKYTFKLKREAAGPAAAVVVPSIVIVLLTLTSLLLDIRDNIRLMLACFSLFGHFVYLSEIGSEIPKHSADTPILLLFIRDSMIMTLFTIFVTLFLMALRRRTTPAPVWMVSVTRLVSSGPGKYVVFTEFDPTNAGDKTALTEEGSSSLNTDEGARVVCDWMKFANLLNSLVFIISVLIYFILVCVYIPYGY